MDNKLLTIKEVEQLLGVSRFTIRKLTLAGKLSKVKLGYKTVRYEQSEIEDFIERSKVTPVK